jgi:HlyD family secretion protein
MRKVDSTVYTLVLAALMASAIGYYAPNYVATRLPRAVGAVLTTATPSEFPPPETSKRVWAAAAPGRVEPVGGEIRLAAQSAGRIVEVLVASNDKVVAGDLLVRLDDEDAAARVGAAEAEAAVRKRNRDSETVTGPAQERRTAEDAVATSENQLVETRAEFDRLAHERHAGTATDDVLAKQRELVTTAKTKLEDARANLRKIANRQGMPPQTQLEAALTAARADLTLAHAAFERTRMRAPTTATVLQVNARAGETVAPSLEAPLIIIGDLTSLRVRAEIEERDVAKVRVGQGAVVRSDAFVGKEFEGKVGSIAQTLGPGKLSARGPRKPNDVDVLEVLIDLDDHPPLLPGMKVDVFLKAEATAQAGPPAGEPHSLVGTP